MTVVPRSRQFRESAIDVAAVARCLLTAVTAAYCHCRRSNSGSTERIPWSMRSPHCSSKWDIYMMIDTQTTTTTFLRITATAAAPKRGGQKVGLAPRCARRDRDELSRHGAGNASVARDELNMQPRCHNEQWRQQQHRGYRCVRRSVPNAALTISIGGRNN